MSEEYVRKDCHDETIRRIEALMARNLAKQEAMRAEFVNEIRDFNVRIDTKLEIIRKTAGGMKYDMTRLKIIMTIIIVCVQIISAIFVHYLIK